MTRPPDSLRVRPGSGLESLVTHGLYQIATGKWRPGERLPSVRQAAQAWDVDPRLVLRAFRRLEELHLIEARARSGFYVLPGPELGRIARHRHELERLYERFEAEVLDETGLSPIGAFHYFAHLAAIRAREEPPCAFVECTRAQAEGHASEVTDQLGIPCRPVTLPELGDGLRRLPDHLRTFLVSSFHISQVGEAIEQAGRAVAAVPVEVSEGLLGELPPSAREGILLEFDETEARNILEDVRRIDTPLELRHEITDDLERALHALLGPDGSADPHSVVLLAPRLWGHAGAAWRDHARVFEVSFRIAASAWPTIADALGLPLGSLAESGSPWEGYSNRAM